MPMLDIAPIRTPADHAAALDRFNTLFGVPEGNPDHDEYLILADLIEAYERRHTALPSGSGVDLLRDLMAAHGLSQADLPEIGPQPVVSAILHGRRRINLRMARALGVRFRIDPMALLDVAAEPRRHRKHAKPKAHA